jgi:diaminopimelate epimerase
MIFWKYQGTGNDFILIDNWSGEIQLQSQQIQFMCDRKFGIGADGVILIEKDAQADFNMNFFNPDGSQSFCGNGSRCAVRFAIDQGLVLNNNISFRAIDGMHEARVEDRIEIKMRDVQAIVQQSEIQFFLNTGSPHVVKLCSDLNFDVVAEGSEIRYDQLFAPGGTNVNFMVPGKSGETSIRTYERGVENETLSCGTGVTASALVCARVQSFTEEIIVHTQGGDLAVSFESAGDGFTNIWLKGPASFVFKGEWNEK